MHLNYYCVKIHLVEIALLRVSSSCEYICPSVQKLENAVGGHQHFQGSSSGFVIHHYAGKVNVLEFSLS